jgi:hypothetical protein
MANQTLDTAIGLAGTRSFLYDRNEFRWQFLLESYQGGENYRRGAHLVRYSLETDSEYQQRLRSTPLDNHCKSVISTYISFMFREPAHRDLDSIMSADVESFLRDADLDGRSFDAFMKETAIWASVFGHCWVLMAKPTVEATTVADQLAQGVRPYVNLLTPLVVTDWRWHRQANGRYDLSYFKYIEDVNDTVTTIREWTREFISTYEYNDNTRESNLVEQQINALGKIPAVLVYNQRSQVRGIGISDIDDIADMQRAIYNELSEVEQSIRLEGHPSLVVTPDVQLGAGAGALVVMPDSLDSGLKPYMLNADATPINMIYESIRNRVQAIDKMANTGGVRATESRTASGIALETEFQLLNAKLSEKAQNLELAEEQIWELWCDYQGQQWMGSIDYPDTFNIRDKNREFEELNSAKTAATSPAVLAVIDYKLMEALDEEPEEIMSAIEAYLPPGTLNVQAVFDTAVQSELEEPEFVLRSPDGGELETTSSPAVRDAYIGLGWTLEGDEQAQPEPAGPRRYSDGTLIDSRLPEAYQLSGNAGVPTGQNCANCAAYEKGLCTAWNMAPVRPNYWCAVWVPLEQTI